MNFCSKIRIMFNVKVARGTYIIAVSGGVDSMVLLDVLQRVSDVSVIVAHCNHGLRSDASTDEALVKEAAQKYNLPFVSTKLYLKNASEATARAARYAFLRECLKKHKADAIITAHHQDDLIETAIINLLRGTGWRGLAPFARASDVCRPLLHVQKQTLIDYAKKHGVAWREDSTNTDQAYLRNYVRHTLIPRLQTDQQWRSTFLERILKQQTLATQIDAELAATLPSGGVLSRYLIIMLPKNTALEVLRAFLQNNIKHGATRPQAQAMLLFTKVALPHKIMPINQRWQLRATKSQLIVEPRSDMIRYSNNLLITRNFSEAKKAANIQNN